MTMKQAITQMEKDKKAVEIALDWFRTANILWSIGEPEKAINLYASAKRKCEMSLCH